jgi:hypothetical protein
VTYTPNFTASDSLKVTASNGCGTSPVRFLKITRNNPARPGVVSGPLSGLCNVSGIPYSVVNVAGMTYNWAFSTPAATVVSGQGTNAITAAYTAGYSTGTLNVTATNACGTSAVRTISIKSTLNAPTGLTGALSVCANQQNVPYSCNSVSGATNYTWSAPAGARIFDGAVLSTTNTLTTTATSVTVNFAVTAGNVRVKANNPCGAGSNATLAVAITCREAATPTYNTLDVSAYPNPAENELFLSFNAAAPGEFRIRLMDLTGKEILTTTGEALEGLNEAAIYIDGIAPGIYLAETTCGGKTNLLRIAIQ